MKPIVVISHERSGTHLCMNLIAANFGMAEGEWIDMGPAGSARLSYDLGAFASRPDIIRKSHHQAGALVQMTDRGNNLELVFGRYHVIYVMRELPAVMVSCWHYFLNNGSPAFPKCQTFDEFLDINPSEWPFDAYYSVVKSNSMPERWKRHTDGWMRFSDRITVLKFEELANAPETAMLRVGMEIGKQLAAPVKIERGKNCVYFRRGEHGSWADEITVDQGRQIYQLAAV